ncbi:hypothetical protein R1sor_001657 [Riccia sorocarpa]|uniref:Maintenance of Photosystem II under High light 2 C-terminal domain-containing protein n=1 Tax=Riccia sorocarpa TaxID=122646 RepID=A0ABD3GZY9_9MARC
MASALSSRVAIPSSLSLATNSVQQTGSSSRKNVALAVRCEISDSVSVSSQAAEEKWTSTRRDVVGGAAALLSAFLAAPASALLEADEDEALLEKVKSDRQKRIQKRGAIASYKKETEYVQKAVYELSKTGKAIDTADFSTASAVLGSSSWIANVKTALSTVSKSPEEQGEAETFSNALASLQSAVSKKDTEASKSAFVTSASALEKWTSLTGFSDQVKGL